MISLGVWYYVIICIEFFVFLILQLDFKPADVKPSSLHTMAQHARGNMLPGNHELKHLQKVISCSFAVLVFTLYILYLFFLYFWCYAGGTTSYSRHIVGPLLGVLCGRMGDWMPLITRKSSRGESESLHPLCAAGQIRKASVKVSWYSILKPRLISPARRQQRFNAHRALEDDQVGDRRSMINISGWLKLFLLLSLFWLCTFF